MSYTQTILIQPRNGMTDKHMKEIEDKVGVNIESSLKMELSTPTTVNAQKTKDYSYKNEVEKKSSLDKYKIKSVPDWFDKLSNPVPDTPVIQIQGDQTPNSDSEYELNVPELNNELANIINTNNDNNNNNNDQVQDEKQDIEDSNDKDLNDKDLNDKDNIKDPNDYEIKPKESEPEVIKNGNSDNNTNNNDNPH